MIKIVIGGQLEKRSLYDAIKQKHLKCIQIIETDDELESIYLLQSGEVDYYIGVCMTGSGGALGLVSSILGNDITFTVSSPVKISDKSEVIRQLELGKRAFGFCSFSLPHSIDLFLVSLDEYLGHINA